MDFAIYSKKPYIPLLHGGVPRFWYNVGMANDKGTARRTSAHAEIFKALRRDILLGKFKPSDKFPSEQQLMRRFHVSRATLRIALDKLKHEEIIETRNGSGTYLSPLARRVAGRLGIIVPHIAGGELSPPICSAISHAAGEEGYSLLFGDASSSDGDLRAQRFLSLAWDYVSQGVAGVFIEPIELVQNAESVTARVISFLEDHNVPVVLLDRDIVSPPNRSKYDLVSLDNVQIGYRLVSHLAKRGARRICLLARENSAPTVTLRFQGAREAILDAGLKWTKSSICHCEPNDVKAIERLFKSGNGPDAFLCANDITAVALMESLRKIGKKVPRDVLVTGVDDVRLAAMANPPLTTVRQPCGEIAKAAVAAMLQRLRNPSLPPRQILLDAPLVRRASTASATRPCGSAP